MGVRYVQTTIPQDSWKKLKIIALQQEQPMGELLRNLILEFIDKNSLHIKMEEINNG